MPKYNLKLLSLFMSVRGSFVWVHAKGEDYTSKLSERYDYNNTSNYICFTNYNGFIGICMWLILMCYFTAINFSWNYFKLCKYLHTRLAVSKRISYLKVSLPSAQHFTVYFYQCRPLTMNANHWFMGFSSVWKIKFVWF